jgi:crossover junction endodeoxyribonuclease RuvC
MQILGIDPGSRFVGWGRLSSIGQYIDSGEIKTPRTIPLYAKFGYIHGLLHKMVSDWDTELNVAVESVFVPFGPGNEMKLRGALVLAQARGAILAALNYPKHQVVDYAPSTVKKMVTGHGHSDKATVTAAVEEHFGLKDLKENEADALAMALTLYRKGLSENGQE